ncbi:GNAT family N-acetyltransferase [Frigoribacterium faeni]|uniref:N-acetyltransferase n=1 Tax=Frigoribacterium faeni TaxID=145483 RepID=A0A7W3PHN0_9MICO|nr:GNAT family N-acetyltransferase [Frigoribacterium faeni]MBA8811814.1 GNAT superfamily N-acetyltransferase [Frigoribacterium faeni]BFF12793.1 GNAT family N-acetyltransferase [Microbacterium flavescens]GEK83301.1 N-acetyltransferase [Frigoribacterium faeni]
MLIRPAVRDDAEPIARVHLAAWREAYAHLVPLQVLAALSVPERADRWRGILDRGETDVVVAVDAVGDVVGWASASDGRDDDAPRPRELEGLYVLEASYGSGVGQRLLEAAVGTGPAYLWSAADNPRALAFYRRNGFVPDGAELRVPFVDREIDAVRLVR